MRFKLDENIDERLAKVLREANYETDTVRDEELEGITDMKLYYHCLACELILVSLDKDFSNVIRYPPKPPMGIVVLRGPDNLFKTMRLLIQTLVKALAQESPRGRLWIVEPGRLRVHQSSNDGP